jgi:TonB-dependent starch-binding outer membrane protein SusC
MLFQEPIPHVFGIVSAPSINIGEMKNTGFDIELGYNNTVFDNKVEYNVTGTISRGIPTKL